jgi:hypothetical protein
MAGNDHRAVIAAGEDGDANVDAQSARFLECIGVAVIAAIDQDRTNVLLEIRELLG